MVDTDALAHPKKPARGDCYATEPVMGVRNTGEAYIPHPSREQNMNTPTYIKHKTKEERIAAWKLNRELYNEWRKSADAKKWITRIRKKQQGLCFICMKPLEIYIHVDHIFPLYLGGTNSKLNLCITHPACNMDKGVKVYTTYRQASKRRAQFNNMRKAKLAMEMLKRNPTAKLSKKNKRAIKLYQRLKPL